MITCSAVDQAKRPCQSCATTGIQQGHPEPRHHYQHITKPHCSPPGTRSNASATLLPIVTREVGLNRHGELVAVQIHILPCRETAVFDATTDQLIGASEGAWEWLGWLAIVGRSRAQRPGRSVAAALPDHPKRTPLVHPLGGGGESEVPVASDNAERPEVAKGECVNSPLATRGMAGPKQSMRRMLEDVLALQPQWTANSTPVMRRRGDIVRTECVGWLRDRLHGLGEAAGRLDLAVEGSNGIGRVAAIPWVRVHPLDRSPSATLGWYIVYLFAPSGDEVFLSLMQGTTRVEKGDLHPRDPEDLAAQAAQVRRLLGDRVASRPDLRTRIALGARKGKRGPGYEAGSAFAFEYRSGEVPDDEVLLRDLHFMATLLGEVYRSLPDMDLDAVSGTSVAVRSVERRAPEVEEARQAADIAAGRPSWASLYCQSPQERRAIEQRAVELATRHLKDLGYEVADVGATRPYDLHATRAHEMLFVEVKGSVSSGEEIVLTRNEVELHRKEYPRTMLVVVRRISLDRSTEPLRATGGELVVHHPWAPDPDLLVPLSYSYAVPDTTRE